MAAHRPPLPCLRAVAPAAVLVPGTLLLSLASPAHAQSPTVMHGFCFRSPLPLSAPQTVGLDALLVAHPPEAGAREEHFSLTAMRFALEVTDTKAGMTPAELRDYVKVTFLAGRSQDGTPLQRWILDRMVEGEAFTTPIPAPSIGEVFVLRRSDGDSVVLGFKLRQDWAAQGRELITAITVSLREGEASCDAASRSSAGRTSPTG